MKMSAMPLPMTRRIHSSKFLGGAVAMALATVALMSPLMQLIWSSRGSEQMLFWKG
jgi:hypothetical protein